MGPFLAMTEPRVRSFLDGLGFDVLDVTAVNACEVCDRSLEGRRADTRFCSETCRVAAYRARMRKENR